MCPKLWDWPKVELLVDQPSHMMTLLYILHSKILVPLAKRPLARWLWAKGHHQKPPQRAPHGVDMSLTLKSLSLSFKCLLFTVSTKFSQWGKNGTGVVFWARKSYFVVRAFENSRFIYLYLEDFPFAWRVSTFISSHTSKSPWIIIAAVFLAPDLLEFISDHTVEKAPWFISTRCWWYLLALNPSLFTVVKKKSSLFVGLFFYCRCIF